VNLDNRLLFPTPESPIKTTKVPQFAGNSKTSSNRKIVGASSHSGIHTSPAVIQSIMKHEHQNDAAKEREKQTRENQLKAFMIKEDKAFHLKSLP
jgi:hypothetical protein